MLPLEQAREGILSLVQPVGSESLPLLEALGRPLAEDLIARHSLPPFDNSAMDGYAVHAENISSASVAKPVTLRLVGHAAAGRIYPGVLARGECVRVFTGSPLPTGADAVIMQEDTKRSSEHATEIQMLYPAEPRENVRFKGDDVAEGGIVMHSGQRLGAAQIGLLAALGHAQVTVRRKPLVGLIATGNELCEPEQTLGPGQIFESNRTSVAALCVEAGAKPRVYPIVPDTLDATCGALSKALNECDAVITSGGVSVGEMDFVKAAFEQMGGELAFWKVAIKPGKPFALGTWKDKLLFALPGNPVSAFVTFLQLVRPALQRMQGAAEELLPERAGVLAEPIRNDGDRRHFVRVNIDADGRVRLAGPQASHLLHSLARANGLVDVPPQASFEAGRSVQVLCWDP